jgi:hypothetical protein
VGALWGICRELVYRGLEKAVEEGTFFHRGPVKKHESLFTGNYEG